MTAAVRADALVAATMPYALTGLAQHMLDFPELGYPLDIEIPGHARHPVTIWVRPNHAHDWTTTAITVDGPATEHDSIVGVRRTQYGTLHGACIRVRILWTIPTLVDHTDCVGDDGTCTTTICGCTSQTVLGPCQGAVQPGCTHGRDLCDQHRHECSECVDDARQVAAEGWTRC